MFLYKVIKVKFNYPRIIFCNHNDPTSCAYQNFTYIFEGRELQNILR